jgi:hypothetical protein
MKVTLKNIVFFSLLLNLVTACDINIPNDGDYGDTVLRGKVVDKADSTPLDSVLFTLAYSKILQNTLYKELSSQNRQYRYFSF